MFIILFVLQETTFQSADITPNCSSPSQQDHDQSISETSTDIESCSKAFGTAYSKTGDLHFC